MAKNSYATEVTVKNIYESDIRRKIFMIRSIIY